MAVSYVRRLLTHRCILRTGHIGECEWNDFDPMEYSLNTPRCVGRLVQIDGGSDNGKWVSPKGFRY